MENKTFLATTTIIGTILGAGIFGIPYVIMLSGFKIGLLHLIIIGSIITLVMLYLGEITLRTKTIHQLPGYAEKYLGKKYKNIMLVICSFGMFSALIAYMVGEGESMSNILFSSSIYSIHFSIIFWLILSIISYIGIRAVQKGESVGVSIIIILIASIVILFYNKVNISNLSYVNYNSALTPFGVVMFAFLAFSIIPEIRIILKDHEKSMKSSILSAYIICFLLYVVFTIIVLGYKGSSTPQIATLALGKPFIVLGMLTMFTAYLGLSIAMIDMLRYDFNFKRNKAWLYVTLTTLAIFILFSLLDLAKFTTIIGIGGALSGGLTAIMIIIMARNAREKGSRKPEYVTPYYPLLKWILIIILVLGAILEIIKLIK